MRKERTILKVSAIKANEGQLPWLPKNPRQWTQTDIDRTRNSIQEDPDFLDDRPLLVVPFEAAYIVFAGNLRREGAKSGKVKEVPAVIYYPETEDDYLVIKRRAMKDNGQFGAWDTDALANEWSDLPLVDWGLPEWMGEGLNGTDESAVDALFEEASGKEKENHLLLSVLLPEDYAEKMEDIRKALEVTLEEWPGCEVK